MGNIYFYSFSRTPKDEKEQARVSLLDSLGVKVYLREVKKGEYRPHYDWALKHLSNSRQ
jgi:hypothetical protein